VALFCCLTSWPYFVLDRTRYIILMLVLPGALSWIFLRLRGGMLRKASVLLVFFLIVNAWMGFVIANRTDTSIVGALREKGFNLNENGKVHHEGLNMFEELCWVNTFFKQGTYTCNWGYRYYTELVNPIPRILWPDKPLVGLDYALARGQGGAEDPDSGGVWATISTGVIGQGIVNFGKVFGSAFAAFLMGLWVAVLARLDLQISEFGRLPLYGLGLGLTVNLGRDLTLGTLYPFVFGAGLIWWHERSTRRAVGRRPGPTRSRSSTPMRHGRNWPRGRSKVASNSTAKVFRLRFHSKP
jgi:hypothetical protein